jgi:hypothetical protein
VLVEYSIPKVICGKGWYNRRKAAVVKELEAALLDSGKGLVLSKVCMEVILALKSEECCKPFVSGKM